LKSYNISEVRGDRYAERWASDRFAENNIQYKSISDSKSDLYLGLAPLIHSNQVELLDSKTLLQQFLNLQRKAGRGRDLVTEGHARDDVANAVAGVMVSAFETQNNISTARLANGWGQHKDPSWLISRSRNSPSMRGGSRTAPNFTGVRWSFDQ